MDERAKATSLSACNKVITNIARSASKLNETIHNAAIMCSQHVKNFDDATICARLVDAMPMSHRRSLLIQWFDAFTPIGIGKDNKSGKMKGFLKGKADERDKMWNLDAGKATPFYALEGVEREPDVPTFDSVHDNIVAFIKRIEKKADSIPDEEGKVKALGEVEKLKRAVAVAG